MADGDKVSWGRILGPLLREPYNHRTPADLLDYTFAQIHELLLQSDDPETVEAASILTREAPPAEAPEAERKAHHMAWCAAVGLRESVALAEWEKLQARKRAREKE